MPSKARTLIRVREKVILQGMLQACALCGIRVQRQNTGALPDVTGRFVRFGRKGNLDLSGIMPAGSCCAGRKLEIETKAPGKRPTKEQYARMAEINGDGGLAFWTDDAAYGLKALRLLLQGYRVRIGSDGDPEFYREGPPK